MAGGVDFEMVVTQADDQGNGVGVPNAPGVDTVINFVLVGGGGYCIRVALLTATADAIFQRVTVESTAVKT